jgi:hypothetical protein
MEVRASALTPDPQLDLTVEHTQHVEHLGDRLARVGLAGPATPSLSDGY